MPKNKYNRRDIIIPIGPSIAYVPLTRGLFATIDVSDIPLVEGRNWCANKSCSGFYAFRWHRGEDGKSGLIGMHAVIVRPEPGHVPDHISGATLDNRRANLRSATYSQNVSNGRMMKSNSTGYRGVRWHPKKRKFKAIIAANRKTYHLGYFKDASAASDAYQAAARILHGEFVRVKK